MAIASRALNSTLAGAAALALLPAAALADIAVSAARIAEGHLWVIGQSDELGTRITLDDAHESATDRSGRFEFRVIYHPATCIVTLKTAARSQRAVVAGCGQAGPKGEAGLAGPPGRPGPAGPPGAAVASLAPDAPPVRSLGPVAAVQPAPRSPDTTQSLPTASLPPAEAPRPPDPPRPRPTPIPVVTPVPTPPPGPPVAGEWLDADGKAKINIQSCGEAVCGAVSWSREGGGIGAQILKSMKPVGPNSWKGTITDPQSGRSYDSTITLQANNTLKVEGCVMGVFCGGQTWTRPR